MEGTNQAGASKLDPNEIGKRVKGIGEYKALKNSCYTRWVYAYYEDVVQLFVKLLASCDLDKNCFFEDDSKELHDTQKFCDLLNHMLESLLDTSAHMTISPSYPRIANNCLPRLLLCYQKRINELVKAWDDQYNKGFDDDEDKKRKHLFFLHGQDVSSMRAYMFFSHLPPDQRIIGIDVPLQQACRPIELLPMLVHEAGHYVGVRNRKARFDFYIEFTAQLFCKILLEKMFSMSLRRLLYLFSAPNADGYGKGNLIVHAFYALAGSFEDICEKISEDYERLRDGYLNSHNAEGALGSLGLSREKAVREYYFSEMNMIMRRVFLELLTDNSNYLFVLLERYFAGWVKKYPEKKAFYLKYNGELQACVQNAIEAIVADLYHQDQESGLVGFLSDKEMVFGEVAADVFMVQICGLDSSAYLRLRFEEYMKKSNSTASKTELDLMISQYVDVQIIAVYTAILFSEQDVFKDTHPRLKEEVNQALHEVKNDVAPRSDVRRMLKETFNAIQATKLKKLLDEQIERLKDDYKGEKLDVFERYVSYIHEFLLMSKEKRENADWISMLQNVASPHETVIEYAWLIYNDKRYDWDKGYNPHDPIAERRTVIKTIYDYACKSEVKEMFRCLYRPSST